MELARIRIVRPDVAVWLVYAGKGRRFWDLFHRSSSIFLSLPGFDANERVFQSSELMRRHLAMADAVGKWVTGATNSPPLRRPSAYNPFPYRTGSAEAKSFSAELGNIERMFVEAKVGDLVLCPPYGHFEPFLVGEISQPWRKSDDIEVPLFEGEAVPARKVRWLPTALARRDFSPRVSRRLQNQHAITRMDADLYPDILEKVYPSFVWGDRSKLDIFGENYSGTDPLQPYAPALLIKYVLASVFAFDAGEFDKFQAMEPLAAIDAYYDEDLIEHFGQHFNSPGRWSIIAAVGSMSILASAGMIVATADPSSNFTAVKDQAAEAVKGSMKGAGKGALEDDVDNYVGSMKSVDWKKVQTQLGKPATKSMDLTFDNRREVAAHRAELNAK